MVNKATLSFKKRMRSCQRGDPDLYLQLSQILVFHSLAFIFYIVSLVLNLSDEKSVYLQNAATIQKPLQ